MSPENFLRDIGSKYHSPPETKNHSFPESSLSDYAVVLATQTTDFFALRHNTL